MTYNLTAIMKDAWAIARRFEGNGKSLRARLSHALKAAWWSAKEAARVAATVARAAQEQAQRIATRSLDALRAAVDALENKTRLGPQGHAALDQARADLRAACAQRTA